MSMTQSPRIALQAGWHPAIALQRMVQWAPHHFDKAIFEQFVQTVGIYPLGSLVRLQSQHLLPVVLDASPTCLRRESRRFLLRQSSAPHHTRDSRSHRKAPANESH